MLANPHSELQKAIVLHTRPYQNSSLLVDFFTEHNGIVRCVAKGARSKRKSEPLSQFCHYKISFSGKSDLKTLKAYEPFHRYYLSKTPLLCGFYVNELCLRLLHVHDPYPKVFQLLMDTLAGLSESQTALASELDVELILRRFEFSLLQEIGYLVDMEYECLSGAKIEAEKRYQLLADRGFAELNSLDSERSDINSDIRSEKPMSFAGATLVSIHKNEFECSSTQQANLTIEADKHELHAEFRKETKMLSRLLLAPLLGSQPLQSRNLFAQLKP